MSKKENLLFLRQINQMTLSRALYLLRQVPETSLVMTGDSRAPVGVNTHQSFNTDLLIVLGNSDEGLRAGELIQKLEEVSKERTNLLKSEYPGMIPDAPIWLNHTGSPETDIPLDHFYYSNKLVRMVT